MDLDLALVASFVALVAEEHYGRAARHLNMTPSALTKRIQRLERQLGSTLVQRGPAGVMVVTAQGRRFASVAVPLLAQARAARDAARTERPRFTLRLGIPAGTGAFLRRIDMAAIASGIRSNFPEVDVSCVDVPLPSITQCLPQKRVDVLWTNAAVRHSAVDTFPLPIASTRVGLVGAHHPLAEAEEVTVEQFVEHPILYDPTIPDESMSPLWLADVRNRRDAHLVTIDATSQASFLRHASAGTAAMVTFPVIASPRNPLLRTVALTDVAPVRFQAACLRTDRRGPVRALLEAVQGLSPRCW